MVEGWRYAVLAQEGKESVPLTTMIRNYYFQKNFDQTMPYKRKVDDAGFRRILEQLDGEFVI